jgi:Cu(I)/Ag(I) efflux system membrane fusion protein
MGLRTAAVTRARLAPRLRTVGFVSADERRVALVTARVTGWVEKLAVGQTGERVEKGQVLATLYSPELVTAQQVYLNATRWSDKGAAPGAGGTTSSLESDARKRIELLGVDKAELAELAKRGQPITSLPLRAPVAGWVAKKTALPGLYLQPGTELFQIADLSTVWVIADVYERDMARVKVGQAARFEPGALPGERFEGRVDLVYPAVSPESRTLQARVALRNPGLKLRPGMFGDVSIALTESDALTAPEEALVDTGELQYVFVAQGGGRLEPRAVRAGARADGRVQLLEGVAEGERVVTTANFLVDSESRLRAAVEGFRPVTGRATTATSAGRRKAARWSPASSRPAPSTGSRCCSASPSPPPPRCGR